MINVFTKTMIGISLATTLLLAGCIKRTQTNSDSKVDNSVIIPFIKKIGKQTDLYIMSLDSKKKYRLTDDAFEEADPILLPDGHILFASKRTGTWQLYKIDLDGKNITAITTDKHFNNYRPSVTIDGRIIFISDRETKPKIFAMDIDGQSVEKLTDSDHYFDYPSPLDDGTILFLSNEGNKWEIWKMNADGSGKQKITNINSNPLSLAAMPSYVRDSLLRSPNLDDSFVSRRNLALRNLSAKAVFTSRNNDGDLELYRINVDGSDLRNLTKMPGVDANPVVLKNGKILFTSDRDGTFDVWIMEPDGYNPINITREPYYASTR